MRPEDAKPDRAVVDASYNTLAARANLRTLYQPGHLYARARPRSKMVAVAVSCVPWTLQG